MFLSWTGVNLRTWWNFPEIFGMTRMTGSPMTVNRDSLQEQPTMNPKRKTTRAKYHISRLSFSLRDSLVVLVSVVIRDTITPTGQQVRGSCWDTSEDTGTTCPPSQSL